METAKYKSIFKILLLLISVSIVSCSNEVIEPLYDNITEGNPLKLEVSEDTIVLNQTYDADQAVLFTWEPGRDRGTDTELTYLFKLDVANSNFETSIMTEEMPAGVFFKSFTTKELNDLIELHWKQPLGEKLELSARIIAKVSSDDKFTKPDYSTVTFTVLSYTHDGIPLYLVGDATSIGWDKDRALEMTEVEPKNIYSWRGKLTAGNFKFLQEIGELLPSYNKGSDNNSIVERTSEEQPDDLFTISEDGIYSVLLSKRDMKVTYQKVAYQQVYYGGTAFPSIGWNNFEEMKWDPSRPDVFETTVNMVAGELKFYTGKSVDLPTFRPLKPDGSIVNDLNVQVAILPDWKWRVQPGEEGRYKISLDTKSLRVEFKKLD